MVTKGRAMIYAVVWSVICVALGVLCSQAAYAQTGPECTPGREESQVDTIHSAVKKPGDPVLICYTLPVYDEACNLLDAESAITEVRLFASVGTPIVEALGPIVVDTDFADTCIEVTADAPRGTRLYYGLTAVNPYGESALSDQRFVKLPGNPKAARDVTVD